MNSETEYNLAERLVRKMDTLSLDDTWKSLVENFRITDEYNGVDYLVWAGLVHGELERRRL